MPAPQSTQEKEVVNIRRVRLPITVTDKKGQFISGLGAGDFLITEDKVPQQIDSFTSEENNNLPLYIGALMDTSPSTAGKLKFEQESAMNFIQTVVRPKRDRVLFATFDDQVTLAFACLYAAPGIPCLYYGTEQGLHGRGNDEAVREAIWGGPGFDENHSFYKQFQKIAIVRAARPSLRYGRFYFRPISGDGQNFEISTFNPGVLAFSRILNDEETVIVANTNGAQGESLDVIVDMQLNEVATQYQVLYSNKANPTAPTSVQETGAVTVNEVGGGIGNGPVRTIRVTLQPYEVQILGR